VTQAHDRPSPESRLDLVTVFRAGAPADILVAKSVLQASCIDFVTKNEGIQDLFGWGRFPRGTNLVMGPIELQVRSCDAQDALDLLKGIPEVRTSEVDG
jgi:hypothetical protein